MFILVFPSSIKELILFCNIISIVRNFDGSSYTCYDCIEALVLTALFVVDAVLDVRL